MADVTIIRVQSPSSNDVGTTLKVPGMNVPIRFDATTGEATVDEDDWTNYIEPHAVIQGVYLVPAE